MAPELPRRHMIANVKEVIGLPKEKLEDRFQLEGNEGVAVEVFGDAVRGRLGMGFIYTNEETVSLGLGLTVHDLILSKQTLNDFLEYFKSHPMVRRMIEGGETLEYSAHLIPDYGYNHLPKMAMPGLLLLGDTAGLVNASHYHEGTNLAMGSGILAAETLIEAKEKGEDIGAAEVAARYRPKLEKTFILKDLFKFRKIPDFLNRFPHYLRDYPEHVTRWLTDYFTISETPKDEVEKGILKKIKQDIGLWRFTVDMFRLGRNMR